MGTGELRGVLHKTAFCFGAFLCLVAQPAIASSQAGRTAGTDDARILQEAWGAFRARNTVLARDRADKIKGVSGTIGDDAKLILTMVDNIQAIGNKRNKVNTAIYKGDSATACTLLSEIQATIEAGSADFKRFYNDYNIYNEKQKAGGCAPVAPPSPPPAPAVDSSKADYDRAIKRREDGRLQDALSLLNRLPRTYKDVDQQITDINRELRDSQKKSQDQLFTEAVNATRRAFDKRDLITARHHLEKAQGIRSSDPSVKDWADQIRKGIEQDERELQAAVTAFYQGKYPEAEKGLDTFLQRGHSPKVVAFARFYAGAALASDFYLTGGKDQQKKDAATNSFTQSFKEDPEFAPRWETVSPRIKALYQEVSKKAQ